VTSRVLRKFLAATALSATALVVALGLVVVGRFPVDGPTFRASDETVKFDCYATPGAPLLVVTFRDQGTAAIAEYAGRRFVLSHQQSYAIRGDVYSGGGATLYVDPEAALVWKGGYSGTCQS
jgi:hypothetical protein